MLPIVLNPERVRIGLAGAGTALGRRRAVLVEAGADPIDVRESDTEALEGLRLLYIAGLDLGASRRLAGRAKRLGVLVHVEDEPGLCDFHAPGIVRRGDLLLTVSSGGHSPGLVKLVRQWLEGRFGEEWAERLADLGRQRQRWRAQNLPAAEISEKTRHVASGWLS